MAYGFRHLARQYQGSSPNPPLFIHKISVEVAIMQVLETTDLAPDDQ